MGQGRGYAEGHFRVSLKVASASPIAIPPTPSGPSVVSAASVWWLECRRYVFGVMLEGAEVVSAFSSVDVVGDRVSGDSGHFVGRG
jgi:hypothetical protein